MKLSGLLYHIPSFESSIKALNAPPIRIIFVGISNLSMTSEDLEVKYKNL